MGVTCQILINRPADGIHRAGNPVTGIVQYSTDEHSRYKDVILSLIGKGKCTWSETRKNRARDRQQTVTYTGREVYTEQHISVYNKGPQSDFILPVGTYKCPFTFILPENIPSSYEDKVCSIIYKLVLTFEKPQFLSINKKFDAVIHVNGRVYANSPEGRSMFGLQKTLFKPFSKRSHRIDLEAAVLNSVFSPGQNIELTCVVKNDTDVTIPSVKAELICYKTYTADCGRRKHKKKIIKESAIVMPSIPDNAVANMTNDIPILGYLYSIQYSRIMLTEYKIKVTMKMPMPHSNVATKMPIVIGERYGFDVMARAAEGSQDEPPSYFEVMSEDKEND